MSSESEMSKTKNVLVKFVLENPFEWLDGQCTKEIWVTNKRHNKRVLFGNMTKTRDGQLDLN